MSRNANQPSCRKKVALDSVVLEHRGALCRGTGCYPLMMRVATLAQLLDTLDRLFDDGSDWTNRDSRDHWAHVLGRPDHPLNTDLPDASLVDWRQRGLLPAGKSKTALDVGCGLGRNARWLARQGYRTTGVDISPYAVAEARRRSPGLAATYHDRDVLREPIPGGPFDVVYDSGCFHHLTPHRRLSYLEALDVCLKPGGLFAICTFAAGKMGTDAADVALLRQGRLEGGIAYGTDDLRDIFAALELLDCGPMPAPRPGGEAVFSMDFLNVALFRRPE